MKKRGKREAKREMYIKREKRERNGSTKKENVTERRGEGKG